MEEYCITPKCVKIVNLTPHAITIILPDGQKLEIPPSGTVARVSVKAKEVGKLEYAGMEVPIVKLEYGDVVGLPEPQEGTIYLVSTLVLMALKDKGIKRNDVFSPDTSPESAIRDSQGRIIGVRRLQTI